MNVEVKDKAMREQGDERVKDNELTKTEQWTKRTTTEGDDHWERLGMLKQNDGVTNDLDWVNPMRSSLINYLLKYTAFIYLSTWCRDKYY